MKVFQAVQAALLLVLIPGQVFALSASEILAKAEPSLVVVRALDRQSGTTRAASGVVVRPRQVITSCDLVAGRSGLKAGFGDRQLPATLLMADQEKGLCLLAVPELRAPSVERGSSGALAMQESVWAVGLPEGTATVEPGILTQLRGGETPLIESTLLGTPQTVGRGLFDKEGHCIGITTVFRDGGQSFYFAAPVEWVDSLQTGDGKGGLNRKIHWLKRAAMLEAASNWEQLRDLSRQWSGEFPDDATAWHTLGYTCIFLKKLDEALAAFQQTIRINPGDIDGWSNLGFVYTDLQRFSAAIHAYKGVVRLNPGDIDAWANLSLAYEASGDHDQAMRAVNMLARLDAAKAREVLGAIEQGGDPGLEDAGKHDYSHP